MTDRFLGTIRRKGSFRPSPFRAHPGVTPASTLNARTVLAQRTPRDVLCCKDPARKPTISSSHRVTPQIPNQHRSIPHRSRFCTFPSPARCGVSAGTPKVGSEPRGSLLQGEQPASALPAPATRSALSAQLFLGPSAQRGDGEAVVPPAVPGSSRSSRVRSRAWPQ